MLESKLYRAWPLVILTTLLFPVPSQALEVGFQGLLSVESSDNVEAVNSPDEEDGVTLNGVIGVYGEQRSRIMQAGFSGEVDTRRIVSEEDSSFDTLTRFLGAAEFSITPRSWKWYVGDILGSVRTDNAVQTIDAARNNRRNIFVTGPSFEYDVPAVSRTRARLLYVKQTEESDTLETLYTADFSYEWDTTPGSYFGFRAGNIFTDLPEDDSGTAGSQDGDFNRSTTSVYWNRLRGFLELYGEVGITRYDADEESLDGLNAELRATRQLGRLSSIGVTLSRDLNDQTLSTIESLIGSGGEAIGVSPEAAGFFAETRVDIAYSFTSSIASLTAGIGLAQLDYQLISSGSLQDLSTDSEDQVQASAFASLSRRLSSRLRSELAISYEQQEYDNRVDNTDSILASAQVFYRLNTSFELLAGLIHDSADGVLTRFSSGTGVEEDIDITENRFTVGVRWAPPSRASQDQTIELKSLLQ